MKNNSCRTFVAKLAYHSIVSDTLSALNCRGCRSPLDIHQPNPNQPEQFLGTCPDCNRWYRVEAVGDEGEITLLQLPEVGEVHQRTPASETSKLP